MHWFWRAMIAVLIPVVGLACLEHEVFRLLPKTLSWWFNIPTEYGSILTSVLRGSLECVLKPCLVTPRSSSR